VGTAIGLGGALALSRVLTSLLFEVSPYDPISYASVVVGLIAVAFTACWLPTRRAMAIDPAVALRVE
jgi:ABC-type lipoprotein release transport system permease subunit